MKQLRTQARRACCPVPVTQHDSLTPLAQAEERAYQSLVRDVTRSEREEKERVRA
jgi:hypothetical protein